MTMTMTLTGAASVALRLAFMQVTTTTAGVTLSPPPPPATVAGADEAHDCFPAQPAAGIGVLDPFHKPAPVAAQLNADAKVLYRLGRWDAARAKYRAAEAADPEFLAPALNVACSFVRQERFSEAMAEALRLLRRAYLPWSDDLSSAADLGALKVRPEGKLLRAAMDEGRQRWAEGLGEDLVFVARTRLPLKIGKPSVAGAAFVLGPRQEVFAWSPRTRRYRQLTSEEGRVLALARSSDGRRIAYVTAEKLVYAGADVGLRGVAVEEMELGTLLPLGRGPVDGDVTRLDISWTRGRFVYRIHRGAAVTAFEFRGAGRLQPVPVPRADRLGVTLTGHGVAPRTAWSPMPGACPGTARDAIIIQGAPAVEVRRAASRRASAGAPILLGATFGAGMAGLPLP